MKLVIVESPTKAKTISKYLDDSFEVRASVGHIRDLPKSNRKAIDIEGGFIPHYEISKGKEKVIAEIKSLAKKADEVYLTTDPDREGEAIAWHLKEVLGLENPKRAVVHEITEKAVKEALAHPREIDEDLRRAQEARRGLDRLVGYDLSGLIWKKVRYGLSAGRVQSPALRIIMEREREIRAFIPEKFWVIEADFKTKAGTEIKLACTEEPKTENEATRIVETGKTGKWSITDISQSEAKRTPRPPFTTSTLQQAASSRLGFSPSRTMGIAQKLYEQGLITYMRTDSVNIGKDALSEIHSQVVKNFGKDHLEPRVYVAKSKNAQEAHEAVRITKASVKSAGSNDEQERLYELIWGRTMASQMSDAKILRTRVIANVTPGLPSEASAKEGKIPDFTVTGSIMIFPGWLAADPDGRGEDVQLPRMEKGEDLKLFNIESTEKATEPPPRYTEAGLVKELEKRDIGRPSTYASIIKTIEERGYVEKLGKALRPTDTGDVVSSFLEANFGNYISDSFTAEMEDKLDAIAEGKKDYRETLEKFYKPFLKDVKAKEKDTEKITNLGPADPALKCPDCGSGMVIKLGRTGKFLSCARFPECSGARKLDGSEMAKPKETGEICPDCGEKSDSPSKTSVKEGGKLIEREGRFGKFISCNRYPKCKFIKKSEEEEAKKRTGVKCPKCADGFMSERRGRFGIFYSCSNYPKCKYAIKAKPTGETCKLCGSLMMQGTKTIPDRCSDKACPNHRPDKLNKS